MKPGSAPGQIVILNGAPRSGKSSIAAALQEDARRAWMNLGVDGYINTITPPPLRPGLGLRPGGERPDLEPLVPRFYAALYESIAAHSRLGFDVVVDIAHHDDYSQPLDILPDCARRLAGLPVLFVGVHCPIETIMARRNAGQAGREGLYAVGTAEEPVPAPVLRWQHAVHVPGIYDLEVDTSRLSPAECAARIRAHLGLEPPRPTAFERLAEMGPLTES
ncbi:MAG: chloramphenicol phosphotransferase [Rhizobiales bacterium]|nr:chloramphenicol phosphotransferase [Hyphomicrobiales bacterium]